MENKENINKISVSEYLGDYSLLEVSYIPFDTKLSIVSNILSNTINAIGGLNTSLLRRIATEVIIENVSNIDMNIEDENGLKGYDQLCFNNELNRLISLLGNEYVEFKHILDERVEDYIRIETNPSVTIDSIYNQIKNYFNVMMDYISERIQNIDVDELAEQLKPVIEKAGVINEN